MLETVTLVLELAGEPMRAREIHAAAEQLAGESLLWKSVKAALAVNADGEEARFERVRRGYYRIKRTRRPGWKREAINRMEEARYQDGVWFR